MIYTSQSAISYSRAQTLPTMGFNIQNFIDGNLSLSMSSRSFENSLNETVHHGFFCLNIFGNESEQQERGRFFTRDRRLTPFR